MIRPSSSKSMDHLEGKERRLCFTRKGNLRVKKAYRMEEEVSKRGDHRKRKRYLLV